MKRLLILIVLLMSAICSQAQALTCAYVVNSDTVYANLTYDRQWIDLLKNNMGYTVKVITDDSASHITTLGAYGGYVLSATVTSADLSNLDTTSRGIVVLDQLLYDDLHLASGQTALSSLGTDWWLNRVDSLHQITTYMSNVIGFRYSGGTSSYAYTGIPNGATVLFNPSTKNWDGEHGTPDTAFCYAIDVGGALTSGTAYGRRVVGLPMYGLLTQATDAGWCHPYELFGNMVGWAFGDMENAYNAEFNCYSMDIATDPGPEVLWDWAEFGANFRVVYSTAYGTRTGYDGRTGIQFIALRYWSKKTMAGYEPDSVRLTIPIPYHGYGVDTPPNLADTITMGTLISTTRWLFDTTTLGSISMYDLHYAGTAKAILVGRTGTGADTLQKGDTINIGGGSRAGTNDTLYYSRTGAGFTNIVSGSQVRLYVADAYGGYDFWAKLYKIIPTTPWTAPLASASQGANPEGSSTRTWANRNYLRNGATGAIAWSTTDLAAGVDYETAALDSFRCNRTTLPPDGSGVYTLIIPGDSLNNPDFNWCILKTFDVSGGNDSTDMELVSSSIMSVRGSTAVKTEMFLSGASPQILGADDSTMTFAGTVGETVASQTNDFVNSGDGVIALDSIVVRGTGSWLGLIPSYGNTPQTVLYTIDTDGLTAGTYTDTVKVYASAASNTPLVTLATLVMSAAPTVAPPSSVEKRTGLRK